MSEHDLIRVVGYARVSTSEQATSGLGLAAQESAIRGECQRRGWQLVDFIRDEAESGKSLDRSGLRRALELVADRKATVLVVAKLDRISRSVLDFAALLEWFTAADAALVALDVGVDTSTPGGRLVANVFASVAKWERDTISARTRDALQAARARGQQVGRPAVADHDGLAVRIRLLREEGFTLQAIADLLNREDVPTVRGATEWRPSSVQNAAGYRRPRARPNHPELPSIGRSHKNGRSSSGSSLKTVASLPILRTRPHLSWLDRAVPTCTALRQGTMK